MSLTHRLCMNRSCAVIASQSLSDFHQSCLLFACDVLFSHDLATEQLTLGAKSALNFALFL